MKNVEINITSNIVTFTYDNDFLIVSRKINQDGIGSITSSFPFSQELINRIESSKIIKIQKAEPSGAYLYRTLPFYSLSKMVVVFTDIMQYYEALKN